MLEMILTLRFSLIFSFIVNVIVSWKPSVVTESIVARDSSFTAQSLVAVSRLIPISFLLEPSLLYSMYAIPASCGTFTTNFLVPATTLALSAEASDGNTSDTPKVTGTFVSTLSKPFTVWVTERGFLG